MYCWQILSNLRILLSINQSCTTNTIWQDAKINVAKYKDSISTATSWVIDFVSEDNVDLSKILTDNRGWLSSNITRFDVIYMSTPIDNKHIFVRKMQSLLKKKSFFLINLTICTMHTKFYLFLCFNLKFDAITRFSLQTRFFI